MRPCSRLLSGEWKLESGCQRYCRDGIDRLQSGLQGEKTGEGEIMIVSSEVASLFN